MSFLVDTDVCSAFLKGNRQVWQRFVQFGGRLHVSAITAGELFTWSLRSKSPPSRLRDVVGLLRDVRFLDVTHDVSRKFGELRADQFDRGRFTPEIDLLIAATAIVHGLTLATHNTRDYVDVPGLALDDWLTP